MATGVYPHAPTSSSSSPSSSPSSSYYYYDCLYHTWPLMYTHTRLPATTTTITATTTTMTVFTTHGHFYIPNTRLPATVLLPSYAILYCSLAILCHIVCMRACTPVSPLHPCPLTLSPPRTPPSSPPPPAHPSPYSPYLSRSQCARAGGEEHSASAAGTDSQKCSL